MNKESQPPSLPVYEHFYSFQGEGVHMGCAAYFIRTYGCPVRCPWCDSMGTWHPEHKVKNIQRLAITTLLQKVLETNCKFVVITGGEPAVHNLHPLVSALREAKVPSHIETSGAYPINSVLDWITVSPKKWKHPLIENLEKSNEIKLIIEDFSSFSYWLPIIEPYMDGKDVWLHPEWSQINNINLLSHIADLIKQYGAPFRAGWQMHKLYQVE